MSTFAVCKTDFIHVHLYLLSVKLFHTCKSTLIIYKNDFTQVCIPTCTVYKTDFTQEIIIIMGTYNAQPVQALSAIHILCMYIF